MEKQPFDEVQDEWKHCTEIAFIISRFLNHKCLSFFKLAELLFFLSRMCSGLNAVWFCSQWFKMRDRPACLSGWGFTAPVVWFTVMKSFFLRFWDFFFNFWVFVSSGFKIYTVLFNFFMGCFEQFSSVPGLYGETVTVLFLNKSPQHGITGLTFSGYVWVNCIFLV